MPKSVNSYDKVLKTNTCTKTLLLQLRPMMFTHSRKLCLCHIWQHICPRRAAGTAQKDAADLKTRTTLCADCPIRSIRTPQPLV